MNRQPMARSTPPPANASAAVSPLVSKMDVNWARIPNAINAAAIKKVNVFGALSFSVMCPSRDRVFRVWQAPTLRTDRRSPPRPGIARGMAAKCLMTIGVSL